MHKGIALICAALAAAPAAALAQSAAKSSHPSQAAGSAAIAFAVARHWPDRAQQVSATATAMFMSAVEKGMAAAATRMPARAASRSRRA